MLFVVVITRIAFTCVCHQTNHVIGIGNYLQGALESSRRGNVLFLNNYRMLYHAPVIQLYLGRSVVMSTNRAAVFFVITRVIKIKGFIR